MQFKVVKNYLWRFY